MVVPSAETAGPHPALRATFSHRGEGKKPARPVIAAWLSLLLFLLIPFLAAAAEPSYPALSGRIVDGAKLLDAEASARIAGKLKAHEEKTTDQVVVATVPS